MLLALIERLCPVFALLLRVCMLRDSMARMAYATLAKTVAHGERVRSRATTARGRHGGDSIVYKSMARVEAGLGRQASAGATHLFASCSSQRFMMK